MDRPLRTKLMGAFVGVVLIGGALTILAGGFFINRMVIGEAQRRVELALKTARAMLEGRIEEDRKTCQAIAEGMSSDRADAFPGRDRATLERLRVACGYDFLYVVDSLGTVVAAARGRAPGSTMSETPVLSRALSGRRPASGVSLIPLAALALEDPGLASRARIPIVSTARAKTGSPGALSSALTLEAATPVLGPEGRLRGAVYAGTVLNGNFELVDFVRQNVFTAGTYEVRRFLGLMGRKPRSLGTVTIFQGDVRIATNVGGADGRRAVGTRVSAEVYDRVLGEGKPWIGPAFVVDSWYLSAYEPLRNPDGQTVGMLYVGVLKDRYDDVRDGALGLFIAAALLGMVGAAAFASWLAARLTRPLARLTAGAAEVARGNLDYQIPHPLSAECDEIKRLAIAFNQMVSALRGRDDELRHNHDELRRTADELHGWVQNYLETLEFITHELKNQIASMKINLLAVRDGYAGGISPAQKEALDDVALAVHRAEEMILNYLNLSRIEKGELKVRARPVQVEADIVRPVLRNLRGRLEARGMRVDVNIPEDLTVQADPSLLQIVYENLLTNAAKYGREQGRIRVSGRGRNGMAELTVWNDGPGVPAGQEDGLFQKFSRLHPPTGQSRGTGLGLFITREIIRRHGGEIRAQGDYGAWIEFVFTLPAHDPDRMP